MSIDKTQITSFFQSLQKTIISSLEKLDGKGKFNFEQWQRAEGGGGLTAIIQEGDVIEKGGVNFSAVFGDAPDFLNNDQVSNKKEQFYATGVSIVIHPCNPWVPIIHMNVRYFEMADKWWFGGGIDLTPHYVNETDVKEFHEALNAVCAIHHLEFYDKFKKWADEYFFIPHRKETRGVGGVFFDHLNEKSCDLNKDQIFSFVQEIGNAFVNLYEHQVQKNRSSEFGEKEKQWQLLRRGRYVEFNLIYDKGTRFGLETNGRIESILMSLPKLASWEYDFQPIQNSPEAFTLEFLRRN